MYAICSPRAGRPEHCAWEADIRRSAPRGSVGLGSSAQLILSVQLAASPQFGGVECWPFSHGRACQLADAQREQLTALLDDIYDDFVECVARSRGKSKEAVRQSSVGLLQAACCTAVHPH